MSAPPPRSPFPRRTRPVTRRFLAIFGPAGLVLALLVAFLYREDVREKETALVRRAEHLLELQSEFLAQEIQEVESDLRLLTGRPELRRFLDSNGAIREPLEREMVRFAGARGSYDQLRILGVSGGELLKVHLDGTEFVVANEEQLHRQPNRYYFERGASLSNDGLFLSPLDLRVSGGSVERPLRPVIRAMMPVTDSAGRRKGLLVLDYLGSRLLRRLREAAATFPGDTVLLSDEGDYLLARDPALEWGWLLGHGHSFARDHPEAWQDMQALEAGAVRDPKGLHVVRRLSLQPRPSVSDPAPPSLTLVSSIPDSVTSASAWPLLAQLSWMAAGGLAMVGFLALRWARSAAAREEQERQLQASETRLRLLATSLLAAQEEERRRISRVMHDELGQLVTAVLLDLRSVRRQDLPPESDGLVANAVAGTEQLLASVRALSSGLRPTVLDDLGLQDAIESHLSEFERRTGIAVQRDLRLEGAAVPSKVGENVYRILQEALANVARHSGSATAVVLAGVADGEVKMMIEDSGKGFDLRGLRDTRRVGILGMRERALLLGGRVEVSSDLGRGTTIKVFIPLAGSAQAGLEESDA